MGTSALAALLFSISASAAPLSPTSTVSFVGSFTPVGAIDLTIASGAGFPNPVPITAGTDDFSFAVGGDAIFNDFSWDLDEGGGETILSIASGDFIATALSIESRTPISIVVLFEGFWFLKGFDPTPGTLSFDGEAMGELGTFTAEGGVVIPLPGALFLFAGAISGLGLIRRRR